VRFVAGKSVSRHAWSHIRADHRTHHGFGPRSPPRTGDAGVPPDGSGFRGVMFSYVVRSEERVDAVLAEAERAGGEVVKPAQQACWGGYFGYFADPDGYL
jgi:catechol 2,3-dioxygenase-like lactoylglutathione lyase family enzyme